MDSYIKSDMHVINSHTLVFNTEIVFALVLLPTLKILTSPTFTQARILIGHYALASVSIKTEENGSTLVFGRISR